MKFGRSCIARPVSVGYGQRYVVVPSKLLRLYQATTVLKPVPSCGRRFQKVINVVTPSVTCGMLTAKCFLKQPTAWWVKKRVRPIIWSVGIASCGNVWLALFARPYPSPNLTPCTKSLLNGSSLTTISPASVMFEPLPKKEF